MALAAAQLRAASFLRGPWRELWELLLGFFCTDSLPFGYSVNPGATAELTHSAVSAFRQAQIIHRPVGGCDKQPLSDEGQVLC